MDKRLNDILENLDENINISDIYKSIDIEIDKSNKVSTKDLQNNLVDADLLGNEKIKIYKNTTENFDSIFNSKKLKKIDLTFQISFIKKIKLALKGKMTLSGNSISLFQKRLFFSKTFFKKIIYIFLFIGIFLIIDAFIIVNRINSGYNKLITLKENSGDMNYVKKTINDAKFDFILSDILFKPFLLIPSDNIRNGYYILQGGKNLTTLLDNGLQVYISTASFIDNKGGIENIKLTNLISNLQSDIYNIRGLLYDTLINYKKVGILPEKRLNIKFGVLKDKLKLSYKLLDIINRDFDEFLKILGNKGERKYLILFQNNDEIRATGGFIGSIANLTLKDGKVIDFKKDDIYAYEWELNKVYTEKTPAPEGLNKITKTFGLRDANYFVDFETSSKKINFFLKKINKDIDGIIYINQDTILDFLKLTGGINLEQLGEKITEENFSLVISTLVEAQAFKIGTLGSPKQILFDFANVFISKLKTDKDYFAYIDIILKNIKSRDLVLYSFNTDENNLLWKLGVNGKINYSNSLDYSYPVYTSIGGNKTDRYIKLKYKKEIEQNADCSINTNLDIYRTHSFSKSEEKKVNLLLDKYPIKDKTRKDIVYIQGKGENKTYVRVLLPKGIVVETKEGMKVNYYQNSTVLEFYINTRLLETTNYNIKYTILNRDCKKYNFIFYKQPGIRKYNLEIKKGESLIKKYGIETDYNFK